MHWLIQIMLIIPIIMMCGFMLNLVNFNSLLEELKKLKIYKHTILYFQR